RENKRPNYRNSTFYKLYFGPYAVFLLVFTIGTCISVMQRWIGLEKNKEEIEREKLNTELSFLKSQVNPHFFFNTLNNIYS
ncbi:histidine kinase, partial [Acinetobacter baumannii]